MDSMDSVEAALRLGVDAAEVDVRKSARGLILSHDRRAEAGYAASVTLEEVFAAVAPHPGMMVNCDIKEADILPDVLELAARCGFGRDRLVLSGSVYPPYLGEHPEIAARAQIALNVEGILAEFYIEALPAHERTAEKAAAVREDAWTYARALPGGPDAYIERVADICAELRAASLNLPVGLLTPERMQRFRALDLPLSVWTVDDPDRMKQMFAGGVANLTTKRVREALDIRRAIQKG